MPEVPVLSALTELLSGAVPEEFKKLFKPSALVAAAIFLTLNLVLILPALREAAFGPVAALDRLSSAWQIVVGTLLLFALAYVFNSLGGAFLELASGASVAHSPLIGDKLSQWQLHAYEGLRSQATAEGSSPHDRALATERLASEFPDEDAVGPTRLGNVLASTSAYIMNRYGASLNTIWPFMDMVLQKEDDSTLRNQLNENRDALTFLTTLSALFVIVAVELALAKAATGHPGQALWALAVIAVAYLIYNAAVLKAKAWRTDVLTAFELYLDKVAEKLHLAALQPSEWEAARDRWQAVSRWLAYGGSRFVWPEDQTPLSDVVKPKGDSWYTPAPPSTPQLRHPATVTVQPVLERPSILTDPVVPGKSWACARVVDYCYAISNPATGKRALPADGVFLVVKDPRHHGKLERTPGTLTDPQHSDDTRAHPPTDEVWAEPQPSRRPESLFWYVGRIAPAGCRVLQYEIKDELAQVTVASGPFGVVEISPKDKGMQIDCKRIPSTDSEAPESGQVGIELPHGQQLVRARVYTLKDGHPESYQDGIVPVKSKDTPTLWTFSLEVPNSELFRLYVAW
jgi:hypothetical protein